MRPSCPWPLPDSRVFACLGLRDSQSCLRCPLMDFRSPSENSQVPSGRLSASGYPPTIRDDSSLGVSSPTAFPHVEQRLVVAGFTSPVRLRLQVFSTSWRLHPPHVCWPYFMPDPLLGFALQSFPPPAQPARRLRRPCPLAVASAPEPSRKPTFVACAETPRQ